jgi:hypothetical protein
LTNLVEVGQCIVGICRRQLAAALSTPPTPDERLAADGGHLQGRRIAIMPHKCKTIDEWTARYAGQKDR